MTPAYPIAFFDVDSTLVTIEGIDVLADGNPEIAALTEAAMDGSIAIDEVYGRRLEIIKPTRSSVDALARKYLSSMIEDAADVIATLLSSGVDVHLVTAGIEQAILPLGERLGIEARAIHAVRLDFDDAGNYRGFDRRSRLTRRGGKELVVLDVRSRSHGKAVFVGDGATDLEAKDAVDFFIGFGGVQIRERVREGADLYITEARLAGVVPVILKGA